MPLSARNAQRRGERLERRSRLRNVRNAAETLAMAQRRGERLERRSRLRNVRNAAEALAMRSVVESVWTPLKALETSGMPLSARNAQRRGERLERRSRLRNVRNAAEGVG
jgi:hypothetical protein